MELHHPAINVKVVAVIYGQVLIAEYEQVVLELDGAHGATKMEESA
jgi:hypothetical protein